MNQEPTYRTAELAKLFTYWQNQGYEAMNLKLITDLIERDVKERQALNTVGRLKEELSQYTDETVIWWQFYTEDHAFIYGDLWNGITEELLTNDEFQEDLHEFVNGWFDSAQKKIEELEEGNKN